MIYAIIIFAIALGVLSIGRELWFAIHACDDETANDETMSDWNQPGKHIDIEG
ncbi:MAG TPA: hypothetical protein VMY35_17430 [Phycisphaerae bacterium]|nr:hypothetical protein [Phycisphaerae bacterium]